MRTLDELRMKLTEAQLVVEAIDREHTRRLLDGAVLPSAAVRKLSRARGEVRKIESEIRAGRVDQVEIFAPGVLN